MHCGQISNRIAQQPCCLVQVGRDQGREREKIALTEADDMRKLLEQNTALTQETAARTLTAEVRDAADNLVGKTFADVQAEVASIGASPQVHEEIPDE